MNLRELGKKIMEKTGYAQGNLFWYKDKREWHRIQIVEIMEHIAKAKSPDEVYKWNQRLKGVQAQYDTCDFYVKSHSDDQTEPGWRNN